MSSLVLLALASAACADAQTRRVVQPHDQFTIAWDAKTLTLVVRHAAYARLTRLKSGDLLCSYQRRGQSCFKRSTDEGHTWGPEHVITAYQHGTAANPELLQLSSGTLMLLYNERPSEPGHPYTIMRMLSHDEGQTWQTPRQLYVAGATWDTGCWEPIGLEYPDGEVQVFFANEAPYRNSKEQEISMISSTNPKNVRTVSFRAKARDGMPVPCLLNDGKTVVIAIEDSNLNGKMKPVILTSSTTLRWKQEPIDANSPRRQRALRTPLSKETYAGAPYLCQMPSGLTLLSVQSDEGADKPRMVVYVGNDKAHDFTNRSVPFPEGSPGMWNALFVKNQDTVTAVSGTTVNGVDGIWLIDGQLQPLAPTPSAPSGKVR